jgi:hypothetical protein
LAFPHICEQMHFCDRKWICKDGLLKTLFYSSVV